MNIWIIHKLLKSMNLFLAGLLVLVSIKFVKEWITPIPAVEGVNMTQEVKHTSIRPPIEFKKELIEEYHQEDTSQIPVFFHGMASNGTRSFAFVETQGKQSLVGVGQSILNYKVREIEKNQLTLESSSGERVRLSLASLGSRNSRLETSPAPSQKESMLQTTHPVIKKILSNWAEIFRDVQIIPFFDQGKAVGYELLNIRPQSFIQEMGFRIGDIIEKINGREATNLESLMALYNPMESNEIKFIVKRGPKRIELVYHTPKDTEMRS